VSSENLIYVKHSGTCESHTPCELHAHPPESVVSFLWVLKREKSIRQTSLFLGGSARPSPFANISSPFQGKASSTVQPLSVSSGLLMVPSMCTADNSPG